MTYLNKALAWVSVGLAVAVACWVTKTGWWLWFMVIPLLAGVGGEAK